MRLLLFCWWIYHHYHSECCIIIISFHFTSFHFDQFRRHGPSTASFILTLSIILIIIMASWSWSLWPSLSRSNNVFPSSSSSTAATSVPLAQFIQKQSPEISPIWELWGQYISNAVPIWIIIIIKDFICIIMTCCPYKINKWQFKCQWRGLLSLLTKP